MLLVPPINCSGHSSTRPESTRLPPQPAVPRPVRHRRRYQRPPSWLLALTATRWNRNRWLAVAIALLQCIQVSLQPSTWLMTCSFLYISRPHSIGCYGVPKEEITDMWLCDPCANEKTLEASLVSVSRQQAGLCTMQLSLPHNRTSHAYCAQRACQTCVDRSHIDPESCPSLTFFKPSSRPRGTNGRTSYVQRLRRICSGRMADICN